MTERDARGWGHWVEGAKCSSEGCDNEVDACCDYCFVPICRECRYDEEDEGQELCPSCSRSKDDEEE